MDSLIKKLEQKSANIGIIGMGTGLLYLYWEQHIRKMLEMSENLRRLTLSDCLRIRVV